jgi:hypothetical protein
MAMMAMTTRSSIKVKAFRRDTAENPPSLLEIAHRPAITRGIPNAVETLRFTPRTTRLHQGRGMGVAFFQDQT